MVRISAGAKTGAYFQYANRYAQALKKEGITLEVLESTGSVENLARINDPKSGVDFAFVQSGISDASQGANLESLASVAYEPVWVLSRSDSKLERLPDLQGKRVAVGVRGSGTQPVALELLRANGVKEEANLRLLSAADGVAALGKNELDAVITISAPNAPVIEQALAGGTRVIEFDQAEAFARRYP